MLLIGKPRQASSELSVDEVSKIVEWNHYGKDLKALVQEIEILSVLMHTCPALEVWHRETDVATDNHLVSLNVRTTKYLNVT